MSLKVDRQRALSVVRTLIRERDEARAQLANAAASEVDAVQGRQECECELREARAAIVELADYLKRVADYRHVDVNELEAFVAETKRMYGQEDAE